jgi:hypothetical protein
MFEFISRKKQKMFSRAYPKQGFMKPTMEVVLNGRN